MSNQCQTVQDLRQLWQPHKTRLSEITPNHSLVVRMHRAFSWMQRSDDAGSQDSDLSLITLWIAFNAIYGRWDESRREPMPDKESWKVCLKVVLQLDGNGLLPAMLTRNRDLVMTLYDDEFLSNYFWEEPSDIRASKSRKVKFDARTWYIEGRWGSILERVVERIYLLRCQLVHGASTLGGKLNRECLANCVKMLREIVATVLMVIIQNGSDCEWGPMCYPPIHEK